MKKLTGLKVVTFFAATFLVSCASTGTLNPGAANINVVANQNAPKGCQLRGQVSVSKTDIYGPSHKVVQNEQLDMLRNQAAQLGANFIVLTNHKTKYYHHPKYIISQGKAQRELDAHALSGNAYLCKSDTLHRLNSKASSSISDIRPQDE
jgi:pyruvate/2-oxoglutarate dehydrogenase complex dihydrolipoamide dehydrogenase (E3) component